MRSLIYRAVMTLSIVFTASSLQAGAITTAVASGPSDSLAPALALLEPVIPPLAYHLLLDVVRAAVAEIG